MVATRIPTITFLKMFLWFLMIENQKTLTKTIVTTRTNKVSEDAPTVVIIEKRKMLSKIIFMLDVETWSMKTKFVKR